MSLVSQLEQGQISPDQFIVQAAADLKKDFSIFATTPVGKLFIGWAVGALQALLTRTLSPTLVTLIMTGISDVLNPLVTTAQTTGTALAGASTASQARNIGN